MHEYFILEILKIVYNIHPNLPILSLSSYVNDILQRYNLINIVYGITPESDNFLVEDCLVNYKNLVKRLYNININY